MVRSLSTATPAVAPFPNLRLQLNQVAGFEDAMACVIKCCEAEIEARQAGVPCPQPATAICSSQRLRDSATAAAAIYHSELLAMEARFAAELLHSQDPVMSAIANALLQNDYSDLVI